MSFVERPAACTGKGASIGRSQVLSGFLRRQQQEQRREQTMIVSKRILALLTLLLSLCTAALSFAPRQGRGGNPAGQDESRAGVTVRGTVQNFVPVTDQMLR